MLPDTHRHSAAHTQGTGRDWEVVPASGPKGWFTDLREGAAVVGEGGTGVWKEGSYDLAEGEVSQELCIPAALLDVIPIMSVHLTATLGL